MIPDRLGYVTAYRSWQLYHPGFIGGVGVNAIWPPGEVQVAKCLAPYSAHEAPSFNHNCGIHAVTEANMRRFLVGIGQECFGVVALWGRVIKHEFGYRAQYALPLKFLLFKEDFDELSPQLYRYDVPIEVYMTRAEFNDRELRREHEIVIKIRTAVREAKLKAQEEKKEWKKAMMKEFRRWKRGRG